MILAYMARFNTIQAEQPQKLVAGDLGNRLL